MLYKTDLNDRPWQAIKAGSKTIEVRTNTKHDPIDYSFLKKNDFIEFSNNSSRQTLLVKVLGVRHYPNAKALLEVEGTARTLSSAKDLQGGIESINSLNGYRSSILKNGVWAVEVKPIFNR